MIIPLGVTVPALISIKLKHAPYYYNKISSANELPFPCWQTDLGDGKTYSHSVFKFIVPPLPEFISKILYQDKLNIY